MGKIKRKFDVQFKAQVVHDPVWHPHDPRGRQEHQLQRQTVERWIERFSLGKLVERPSLREKIREGERQAQVQDRRSCDADRPFKKIPSGTGTEEKRRFIRDNPCEKLGSVSRACKAVGLTSSTYYYKPKTDPIEKQKKDAAVRDLNEQVQAEFPFYGYRRVQQYLKKALGVNINTKKIRRIMDEYGLRAVIWKGSR